jgi:hypothetical protein
MRCGDGSPLRGGAGLASHGRTVAQFYLTILVFLCSLSWFSVEFAMACVPGSDVLHTRKPTGGIRAVPVFSLYLTGRTAPANVRETDIFPSGTDDNSREQSRTVAMGGYPLW